MALVMLGQVRNHEELGRHRGSKGVCCKVCECYSCVVGLSCVFMLEGA